MRGGINFTARTFGGYSADATEYVELFKEQRKEDLASGRAPVRPDLETDGDIENYLRGINAHILPPEAEPPLRGDYAYYTDATGLYSHSGESVCLSVCLFCARWPPRA